MAKQKAAADATPEPERCRITVKTPQSLKTALKTLIRNSSLDPDSYEKIECDGLVTISIYITPKKGTKPSEEGGLCNAINTKKSKKAVPQPVLQRAGDDFDKPAIKDPPPPKDPLLP